MKVHYGLAFLILAFETFGLLFETNSRPSGIGRGVCTRIDSDDFDHAVSLHSSFQ